VGSSADVCTRQKTSEPTVAKVKRGGEGKVKSSFFFGNEGNAVANPATRRGEKRMKTMESRGRRPVCGKDRRKGGSRGGPIPRKKGEVNNQLQDHPGIIKKTGGNKKT